MSVGSRSELLEALAQGRFNDIIGTIETTELEFKKQPYAPWPSDGQKLEFAKDVSSMANAGGGMIVFGYKTDPDRVRAVDVVKWLTPIPPNLLGIESYRKSLATWTEPSLNNVEMRWWDVEGGKGVVTLNILAADEFQKPVLVIQSVIDGKRGALPIGLWERFEGETNRTRPSDLHRDIQLGRLLRRIGLTPDTLGRRLTPPAGPTDDQRAKWLQEDVTEGGFDG